MQNLFTEYTVASGQDTLRQGDVLEATDEGADAWRRQLVVITADCDIAFGKHQGQVTAVPILPKAVYLNDLHIPRMFDQYAKRGARAFLELLKSTPNAGLTEDRARSWPLEADAADIVRQLNLQDEAATKAKLLLEAITMAHERMDELSQSVEIAEAISIRLGAKPNKARTEIMTRLQQVFNQTPGDALFLSAVAPESDGGYFAYLREIVQIPEHEISLRGGRRVAAYRRISRLQDRYTHALVQRFALVFLSIGLPDDYEDMRNLHAEFLEETFA